MRCGGPRRCCARCGLKRRSRPPPTSITNTKAPAPPAATRSILPCRRLISTRWPAPNGWPPKPAPGQWGSSLALACQLFGLECNVYMVKVSYQQKPYRRMLMHTWGATVHRQPQRPDQLRPQIAAPRTRIAPAASASPSAKPSKTPSLIPHTKYSLGSVLNHVCLHQTVIGQEAIRQMELAGEEPDVDLWLRRRRQQFRRPGLPVPATENQGQEEIPHRGRRAFRLSRP